MKMERCKNPWNKECKNNDIEVYILVKGAKRPVCKRCWNKIADGNVEWQSVAATILGGIGNLPGAMFGGLILGVLEMLGSAYISTAWKDVFVFLILILVLILRPTGLFGEKIADKV